MSMIRWSPMDEMETLRKQLDSMFSPLSSTGSENASYGLNPPVEVVEADNTYRVRFLLPGLPTERIADHVSIEATPKTLAISGEIQAYTPAASEKLLINQFRTGKFYKQLAFPDGIDHESIDARYNNGILEITLPKAVAAQKRNVQIQIH